jgi:hypothetical protein
MAVLLRFSRRRILANARRDSGLALVSWTNETDEDGSRSAAAVAVSELTCVSCPGVWPGVRRAGRSTAERGADAGPAAPQAPP